MNERLNTRNLAERLADETGMDRKRAEEFIEAISSYFAQGLERNKSVKIFGFGVFKIMLVRERESVHIQTGERFVIPAHHKLTFVPDKNFKEQINRPFALFEPIEATESDVFDTGYLDDNAITAEEVYLADETSPELTGVPTYEASTELTQEFDATPELLATSEMTDDLDYEALPELLDEQETLPELTEEQDYETLPELIDEQDYETLTEEQDYEALTDEQDYETLTDEHDYETLTDEQDYETLPEMIDENLPFDIVPVSTTFTYNMTDKITDNKTGDYPPVKEEDDTGFQFFPTDKKKKKVFVWLFVLGIMLCVFSGSFFAVYFFLQNNSDKAMLKQESQFIAAIEDREPLPVGVMSTSDDDDNGKTDSSTTPEVSSSQAPTANETDSNTSQITDTTKKREVAPVVDWIAPTAENARTTQTRRVDGPNRQVEDRNRTLSNNQRQTTASTTTSARTLPQRIRMPAGSTLMQLALEYYGAKEFWVYIYEHNKSSIRNFQNVPVGLELQIPAPNAYGIDAKSAASLQRARQKHAQLMGSNN